MIPIAAVLRHPCAIACAVLLVLLLASMFRTVGLKREIAEMQRDQQAEMVKVRDDALAQVKAARDIERQTSAKLAEVDQQLQQEAERAKELESDVARAVASGERRVRASICQAAGRAGVRGDAATTGSPDAAADDGARRVGRALGAAARCDSVVRALQQYARACQTLTQGKPHEP